MRLNLFGAPALVFDDGRVRALPWQRPTALLAMAVCQPRGIGRDVLATLLRPDADAATARAHLRRNLHRARALLPEPDTLHADEHRVAWRAACDVTDFLAAADARDWPRAAALHTAPLLAGCGAIGDAAIDRWLDAQRESLAARLRVVLSACLGGASGDDGERAGWIERLIALDAFDESAWQLALGAVRGPASRAAALAAVDGAIAEARQQMGVEPLPHTHALRERVFGASGGTAAALAPPAFDWLHGAAPLQGRDELVAAVAGALANGRRRWITLVGVGGVGKTRLALAAGRAWTESTGGRLVAVDLSQAEPGADLAQAIATAAGVAPEGADTAEVLTQWLAQTLESQPLLLLLDNVEQLASDAAVSAWPRRWLAAGPRSAVLVTSREALGDAAEHRVEVSGLEASQAVALVAHHAARLGAALSADDEPVVARIARRLDGHPLGLELAASWLPVMRPAEILAEIDRGLNFLADDEAQPAAHRSLRAVFARSWSLLAPPLQQVLASLTVLHDGFDLDGARAVADARASDLLRLVGQSLLCRGEGGRFRLHPVVRRFAARELPAERAHHLAERHSEHFAARLAALPGVSLGRADPDAVAWLLAGRANLRAAWLHAAARRRVDLIEAMHQPLAAVLTSPARAREMAALWQVAVEAVPRDEPLHRGLCLARAGALASSGELNAAAVLIDELAPALASAADRSVAATVRAVVAHGRGDTAAMEAQSRLALEAAREAGDPLLEARALQNRFVHEWLAGRGEAAEPLVLRMLALAESQGANLLRARALRLLSTLRHDQHRDDEADALLAASTEAFAAVPEPVEVAFNQRNAASNARRRGDKEAHRRLAAASLESMQRLGLVEQAERSRLVLALACADAGELDAADRMLRDVLASALRVGSARLQRRAAVHLAAVRVRGCRPGSAELLRGLVAAAGLPSEDLAEAERVLAERGLGMPPEAPVDLPPLYAKLLTDSH